MELILAIVIGGLALYLLDGLVIMLCSILDPELLGEWERNNYFPRDRLKYDKERGIHTEYH